jgi:hypothetical protein
MGRQGRHRNVSFLLTFVHKNVIVELTYRLSLFLAHNDWVFEYAKQKINEEYGTDL